MDSYYELNTYTPFNLFTDTTKKVCLCTAVSIFIIVLFIITPLSNFIIISYIMKIIALLLMLYTIYLNFIQINVLRSAIINVKSEVLNSQLNINLYCSYIFTIFFGILILFVIKSFL